MRVANRRFPGRTVALVWLASAFIPMASAAAPCAGDCDEGGDVTVDEVVLGVNIALGLSAVDTCAAFDGDASGGVTVDEVLIAITNALEGCATPSPSATPTGPSPTPLATETATESATATSSSSPTSTSPPPSTATSTASPTASATTPPTPTPEPVPTISSALRVWLQEGNYLDWAAESAPHRSAGPHFGIVRTFLNPTVFASLQSGSPSHPRGSALVKELYGSGETILGWSVMVKVQDDSDGGNGWYWFERFGTSGFANGLGEPGCTGCHSLGHDFVRVPFPLQ